MLRSGAETCNVGVFNREADIARYLSAAHEGAVLVSPAISPGAKAVMRAAFNAGMRLIVFQENGFTPMTKPNGEMFDACAEGRLLLLSPWEHHNDRRKLTRAQCQALNMMAYVMCHLRNSLSIPLLHHGNAEDTP